MEWRIDIVAHIQKKEGEEGHTVVAMKTLLNSTPQINASTKHAVVVEAENTLWYSSSNRRHMSEKDNALCIRI